MAALTDTDFQFIARETKARTGYHLAADRGGLLEMRLTALSRREGFFSIGELITTARARNDDRLLWLIADTLSVTETQFFRDKPVFTALRERILPELYAARGAPLRLLSAGCATGQEPYSIAMMLDEMRIAGRVVPCEIVALDVSARVLEKARSGLYSQFEVQRGLPIGHLVRHFEKTGDVWRISDRARAAVKLHRINLLGDLSALGQFDIILCRNVVAHMDTDMRRMVMASIEQRLADDGYIVAGATESLNDAGLALVQTGVPGVFRRALAAQRAA